MYGRMVRDVLEMVRRESPFSPITSANSFPAQWPYIETEQRFNAVYCSRRAGKTESAIRRAIKKLESGNKRVLYINHIRLNAKVQFFIPIKALLEAHGHRVDANFSDLTIELSNGSYLRCMGCSDQGDISTKLGDKWDLILIDEAQDYADALLRDLCDRALLPTLADRRGGMDLLGTPPRVLAGYWYEQITKGEHPPWKWTMWDNPHIPSGEPEELARRRGLTVDSPIYQREFLGMLVADITSVVYEYLRGRNDIPAGYALAGPTWSYAIGLDLGYQDCDAIAVAGWRTDDSLHRIYCVDSWKKNHQDVDQLAATFIDFCDRYNPVEIVGDTGGHGAVKVLKTLETRLGGRSFLPKPVSLLASVGAVNDDYRSGRMLIDPESYLAKETPKVAWNDKHEKFSSTFHSDLTEAWRYAHHAAQAAGYYLGEDPAPPKKEEDEIIESIERENRRDSDEWGYPSRGY